MVEKGRAPEVASGSGNGELMCPVCGNDENFRGMVRCLLAVEIGGSGRFVERSPEDDVLEGHLGRGEHGGVAYDVECGECDEPLGEVRFWSGSETGEGGTVAAGGSDWEPKTEPDDLARLGSFMVALIREGTATIDEARGRYAVRIWEPYDDGADVVASAVVPKELAERLSGALGVEIGRTKVGDEA